MRRRSTVVVVAWLVLLSLLVPAFSQVNTARADEPSRRFFFPVVSTHEPVLGPEETPPDASAVVLPPTKSGAAFPQPARTVGSASRGAEIIAGDIADRVVIAPNSFVIRPGEERLLGVWVADEAGNRYAGDPSYLDLLLFNPAGYQVEWAGAGRIRVKAPDAFRAETLVINVRRKDLDHGRRFINGLANATMVVPKPETVVLPEAAIGLPTTYPLDRRTLLARVNLFPRDEWLRAIKFELPDGAAERPLFPLVMNDDPSIAIEGLRGRWVTSFGEAFFLGKVRDVIARRGGFVLLAVEPAFPWEVLSLYREEFDLEPIINAGIVPIDGAALADSIKALEGERSVQGLADELKSRCKFKPLELDTSAKLTVGELPLPQVKFGAALPFECSLFKNDKGRVLGFDGKVSKLFSAKASVKMSQVKGEFTDAIAGELKLVWESPDGFKLEGERTPGWLFNASAPAWADPIFNINVEFGLGDINTLGSFKPEKNSFDSKAVLASLSGKVEGGGRIRFDSTASEFINVSPHFKGSIEAATPFFTTSSDSSKGETSLNLESSLFGFGILLGVGGAWTNSIGSILTALRVNADMSSLVGVSATAFPIVPSLEWKYISRSAALGDYSKRGGLLLNAKRKVRVQARGALIQALEQGSNAIAKFKRGIDIDAGSWYGEPVRLAGATPIFVQAREFRDQVTIVGEWTGMRLHRVEAWRAADAKKTGEASPLATREGSLREQVTLQVNRPANCDSLPAAEREVYLIGETEIPFLPVAFGWFQLGKVDICKALSLRVPAARGLVGQRVRTEGTLSYEAQTPLHLELQTSVVQGFAARPTINPGEQLPVSVSFNCPEEGSFVGRVRVNETGNTQAPLAESPVVVTCLRGPANPPPDDPPGGGGGTTRTIDRFVGWCDPHLITIDGAAYDFHARGEFWGSIHPGMPFQLRFLQMPNNARATYISRLAARSGTSIVEVAPFRDGNLRRGPALQVLVNGSDRLEELRQLGYVQLDADGYVVVVRWLTVQRGSQEIRYPLEVAVVFPGQNPRPSLSVRADELAGVVDLLGVAAALPAQFAGQLSGLMGNGNGDPSDDFVTRTGQRLPAPLSFGVLYEVFGRSWEVRPEESLFTDGRTESLYPTAPPDLHPIRAQEAEAYCNTISNEVFRRACILDAVVSGDPTAAARIAREVETSFQVLGTTVTSATRGAQLGISPISLAINRSSEATLTIANPRPDLIRYRLQPVGAGPGLRVDNVAVQAGVFSSEFSVAGSDARTHRIGAICPAAEEFVYLLSVIEQDATESRSALISVDCRQALAIQINPASLSVVRGQSGVAQLTLQRENLSGPVSFSLTSSSAPVAAAPAPDKISWTFDPNPAAGNNGALTLTVGTSVATGEYPLTVRASIEGDSVVTQNLSLTVAEPATTAGWRVSVPSRLNALASAHDLLVAIGRDGAILTSSDGTTWEPQLSKVGASLNGIIFGGGKFVAVGESGTILTSVDGRSWVTRTSGTTNSLSRIAFGNGRFVIPNWQSVLTSSDGETWTSGSGTVPDRIADVAFGNGRFVAVGYQFSSFSTDGLTWTMNASPHALASVAYFGGQFHALTTDGTYLTSANGESWSARSAPWSPIGFSSNDMRLLATPSHLIANIDRGEAFATANGTSWTTLWTHPEQPIQSAASKNGQLFILFSEGAILASSDLRLWSHRFGPLNFLFTYQRATYHNGRYWVATSPAIPIGEGGTSTDIRILSSPDGSTWSLARTGLEGGGPTHLLGGNGRLVLVTDEWRIYSSQDGLNWTLRVTAPGPVDGLTYSHGKFVAVGPNMVLTSSDGESWTSVGAPSLALSGVTGGRTPLDEPLFVAVSQSGRIAISSDGTTWSLGPQLPAQLYGIAYGQGLFVAVGANGKIFTSPNGSQWTETGSGTMSTLDRVTAGETGFIADGGRWSSAFIRSHNGLHWEPFPEVARPADGVAALALGPTNRVLVAGTWTDPLLMSESNWNLWSTVLPKTPPTGTLLTAGNGQFVAIDGDGAWTSADGATWQPGRLLPRQFSPTTVQFANGRFIAGGDANGSSTAPILLTSPDGGHWTPVSLELQSEPYAIERGSLSVRHITFGNGRYVALAEGRVFGSRVNLVVTSSDGSNWYGRVVDEIDGSIVPSSLVFGNGRFLIAGASEVWTSPDGSIWTWHAATGLGASWLRQVVFANGRFVGALGSGAVATSSDGITWTVGATLCRGGPVDLRVLGSTIVGVCWSNAFASNDGVNWSTLSHFPPHQIVALTASGERWVAVTQSGSILTYS